MRTVESEENSVVVKPNLMQLARMEDVSPEELEKKYMRSVEAAETMTDDEARKNESKESAMDLLTFLGLEDELDIDETSDNPLGDLTDDLMKFKLEELEGTKDPAYREQIKKDKLEILGIEEIDQSIIIENDDPFLEKEYKREQEKIANQLAARKRRKEIALENKHPNPLGEELDEYESFNFGRESETSRSGYRQSASFSGSTIIDSDYSSSKTRTKTSSNTESTSFTHGKPVANDEENQKRRAQLYEHGTKQMLDMIYNGPKKQKKEKERRRFGRKEKFSFKGLWKKTKAWFSSEEAAVMAKIGAMLCLQTGMAIMTKRLDFDNGLQAVTFIGMMLGVFYVGNEVRAEGFDFRRLNFM